VSEEWKRVLSDRTIVQFAHTAWGTERRRAKSGLTRWHKPRTGIFGWEVPTVCIDSTVSSSSAISLSRAAHPRAPSVGSLLALSNFRADAPIVVIRYPAKPCLRTVTPPVRFGGLAQMPSIALTREATPWLRFRDETVAKTGHPGFIAV
jgi:hypothetical protein